MRVPRSILIALALSGCAAPPAEESASPDEGAAAWVVASPAFDAGAPIPREHTCDGANTSPPLAFADAPANATHLALIAYDSDAPVPEAPTRNITHWLLWNAPLANGSAAFDAGEAPEGAVQGANERGEPRYMGPCPPPLSNAHRYVFWAFALDAPLGLAENATRAELEHALRGHVLASGTLVGTYRRALPAEP